MEIPDDCEIDEDALQFIEAGLIEQNSDGEYVVVMQEANAEYELAQYEIQQQSPPSQYQNAFRHYLQTAQRPVHSGSMDDSETSNDGSYDSIDTGVQSQSDLESITPITTPEPDDFNRTLVPELSISINGFGALTNQSINSMSSDESAEDGNEELLNPFNINFAHIYEQIFSYLHVKDILNLTEVSRGFYKLIGMVCREQMSRIKLVVSETHNRRVRDELMNSTRKYQHIEIRGLFDSTNEVSMLVRSNADSLMTIRTSYDFPCPFNLPSLQEIAFIGKDFNCSAINFATDGFLRAAFKAKRLYVWIRAHNPGLIAAYIRDNYNLEKLVLEQNSSWQIISELYNFDSYKCKLQTLHVDLGASELNNCELSSQRETFFGFIERQKDSLREIKFGGNSEELSDVLNVLPHLEKITYAQIERSYWSVRFAHPRLKEANLINVPWQFVKRFLEQNPRLEKLYVSHLDKNLLKQIVALGSKIKVLRFALLMENCDLNHLKRYYEIIRAATQIQGPRFEIIQI